MVCEFKNEFGTKISTSPPKNLWWRVELRQKMLRHWLSKPFVITWSDIRRSSHAIFVFIWLANVNYKLDLYERLQGNLNSEETRVESQVTQPTFHSPLTTRLTILQKVLKDRQQPVNGLKRTKSCWISLSQLDLIKAVESH